MIPSEWTKRLVCMWDTAFSVAAPRARNKLPVELGQLYSTPLFKRKLKTFLFIAELGAPEVNCNLNWLCNAPSVGCRCRRPIRNTVDIVLYCTYNAAVCTYKLFVFPLADDWFASAADAVLLGELNFRELHLQSEFLGHEWSVRDWRANAGGCQQLKLLTVDTHTHTHTHT